MFRSCFWLIYFVMEPHFFPPQMIGFEKFWVGKNLIAELIEFSNSSLFYFCEHCYAIYTLIPLSCLDFFRISYFTNCQFDQGYSSLAIALVLPESGRLVACERDAKSLDVAKKYYQLAGVSHKVNLCFWSE